MSTLSRTIEGLTLRRSDDEVVFDRAMRGDSLAFSEVYRRYNGRVYGFCLSRLLSREAASDATQEVFLRVLSTDPTSVRNPGAWLFGVARHVCIDVARREGHDHAADPTELESGHAPVASSDTAEDGVLSRQAAATVMLALRHTNPRYRSALILREIHQQPMGDVAEALGVNVAAAYTILSRARDAFGKAYAEVLDLPGACRTAVEMTYRRTGSGLSDSEERALQAHLDSCARCRREAGRAQDDTRLRSVLPMLPFLSPKAPNLLARAVMTLGSQPWVPPVASTGSADWSAAKLAGAAVMTAGLIAAAVTTPSVVRQTTDPPISPVQPHVRKYVGPGSDTAPLANEDPTQAQYRVLRSGQAGEDARGGGPGAATFNGDSGSSAGNADAQSGPEEAGGAGTSDAGGGATGSGGQSGGAKTGGGDSGDGTASGAGPGPESAETSGGGGIAPRGH